MYFFLFTYGLVGLWHSFAIFTSYVGDGQIRLIYSKVGYVENYVQDTLRQIINATRKYHYSPLHM